MFWPSFNFTASMTGANTYVQSIIVINTVISLTGSCLATFAVSGIIKKQFVMEDLLNASLAGGVAIGASCGYLYFPGVALVIGITAGAISTLGFHFLTPKLDSLKIYDTCGIHNLHAIPGVLGGIFSALVMGGYNSGFEAPQAVNSHIPLLNVIYTTVGFLKQGGLQFGATLTAVAMGIAFGLLAGKVVGIFYKPNESNFY
jgi:ammonium transporter Rh